MDNNQMTFRIYEIHLERGMIGVCPLPGRFSPLADDLKQVGAWLPSLVVTLTETAEMDAAGSGGLGPSLQQQGIEWAQLPITDYSTPAAQSAREWPALSQKIHPILDAGGRVLVHCFGGLGRSGTIALRLMVERGEEPVAALNRLREVRPGAVETDAQSEWAAAPWLNQ